jgi:Transposase DDE domain
MAVPIQATTATSQELAAAMNQFQSWFNPDMIHALQPAGPRMVYTPCVTVWLLVYQRLHPNTSLQMAVTEFAKVASTFSSNKRVREKTLSSNTGAYSRARSRLELSVTKAVADHVFTTIVAATPPSFGNRRVFVMDGTTLSLPSNDSLRKHWPAGANQHGPGTWPICHLVLAHELASGAAIHPEVGAMYGSAADSELALAIRLIPRIPANSLLIADRNFGVFGFFHAAVTAGHDVLTRLTKSRFKALKRLAKSDGRGRWSLCWKPTKSNRKTNPSLPADATVTVWLHQFKGFSGQILWVVTTSAERGKVLADLYAKRPVIETDIRHLKQTLETDALRGQSVGMIEKELAMAMVSYNLVVQVRRLAAERGKCPPRDLSFSGVWSLVTIILLSRNDWTAEEWEQRFEQVLRGALQRKLPKRPGRSFPRTVIPRRRNHPERPRVKATEPGK